MAKKETVAGLDIGSSRVTLAVGERARNGTIQISGIGSVPSKGMRRGVVTDIDRTADSIAEALEHAERMVGQEIHEVYIGISGGHVRIAKNRGVVAVSREDREITEEDVERVFQAARVIVMPPEQEIIDVVAREFTVDGYGGISDPVGMVGVRLELDAMIVMGSGTFLQNLTRSVERAGLSVAGVILAPLALGEVLLTPDERELGAAIIDLGGGTTDIALFREGSLAYAATLPVGGEHITNDLAIGLQTSLSQAERVKIDRGVASVAFAEAAATVEIADVGGRGTLTVLERDVADIIEARLEEIFGMVGRELRAVLTSGKLPGGIVLCGGVAQLPGIEKVAQGHLGFPARVGAPQFIGVNNPSYSLAVGLAKYAFDHKTYYRGDDNSPGFLNGIWQRIRGLFGGEAF